MALEPRNWRECRSIRLAMDAVGFKVCERDFLPAIIMHVLDAASVASLRRAIEDCNDRGLLAASKWQVYSNRPTSAVTNTNSRAADLLQHVPSEIRTASWDIVLPNPSDEEKLLARREEDQLRTARGFFSSKEYARTAFILESCTSLKARFLASYARFLVSVPRWKLSV